MRTERLGSTFGSAAWHQNGESRAARAAVEPLPKAFGIHRGAPSSECRNLRSGIGDQSGLRCLVSSFCRFARRWEWEALGPGRPGGGEFVLSVCAAALEAGAGGLVVDVVGEFVLSIWEAASEWAEGGLVAAGVAREFVLSICGAPEIGGAGPVGAR